MLAITRTFAAFAVIASLACTAACLEPTIIGGTDEAAASTATTTSASSAGQGASGAGGAGAQSNALSTWGDEAPGVCEFPPCEPDDTLWLLIDSDGTSCAAAGPTYNQSANNWRVTIGLPPSRQVVGTHILEDEDDIVAYASEIIVDAGGPSTGNAVSGYGTPGAVLEVVSMDDEAVVISMRGFTNNLPSDGTYELPRCGSSALPPEAIARDAGELDVGAGGAAPEDGSVTVVIGDVVATCTDALRETCDGDAFQVTVTFPPSYLVPGVYLLDDAALRVSHCSQASQSLGGSVEIVAIDDDAMIVRFSDVNAHVEALEQEVRVERCP